MSKAASKPWNLERVLATVGSLKISTLLFILLAILTYAGTLEQQYKALPDVQEEFFESIVFVWWAGGKVPIPLLGGYVLLGALFLRAPASAPLPVEED